MKSQKSSRGKQQINLTLCNVKTIKKLHTNQNGVPDATTLLQLFQHMT